MFGNNLTGKRTIYQAQTTKIHTRRWHSFGKVRPMVRLDTNLKLFILRRD